LSPVTKINIKKVKKERYAINLGKCGSCDIYSVEYKCTNVDIEVTTINITVVKLSNKNPHFKL
jgi:membrane-bound inhibitor of C-type lysozyme